MLDYVGWVPLLILLGFIINGLFGKALGKRAVTWVGCGVVGLSFLLSLGILQTLLSLPVESRHFEKILYTWISAGDFRAVVGFQVDPLSSVMILVVTGVGFLIHVYSVGYMHEDGGYARYFSYLNLFTFSMLILVLANNFLLMFVGWEAVGLCSYLLIGFWFERKSASDAAKKAFIVNRVGDFAFLVGLFLIFVHFKTLGFTEVFGSASKVLGEGTVLATAITLLLFAGATGKSAQIPLYVWLPDAMEGPTPVSALIHAATMVTAGVYMVARTNALFLLAPVSMTVVATVGAVTALFAATIALVQNDIKRVLAYSTISQLGYMFLAVGVGAFAAGIFHLMTHAFFKALLFLAAGSVIHALGGEQDMRQMGGLKKKLPVTYWTNLMGVLAIAGIPGFSGFFSKDEILWQAYSSPYGGLGFWIVGAVTAGLTAFYMGRHLFMIFHGESRVDPHRAGHVHESPSAMAVPLILLAVLAVVGGYLWVPAALGGGQPFESFLAPVFGLESTHKLGAEVHSSSPELLVMGISVLLALGGIGVAYRFYVKNPRRPALLAARWPRTYRALLNKYYVDEFYGVIIVKPLVRGSQLLWRGVDSFVIEGTVNGVGRLLESGGSVLRRLQSGYVRTYALTILGGTIVILWYVLR